MADTLQWLVPVVLSTITSWIVIVIARRDRRANARRAYLEAVMKERLKIGNDLLGAATEKTQLMELTASLAEDIRRHPNPDYRKHCQQRLRDVMENRYPAAVRRLNDASAAANSVLSPDVLNSTQAFLRTAYRFSTEDPVFDREEVRRLLSDLTRAVREELGASEVIAYQRDLFEKTDSRFRKLIDWIWPRS